MQGVVLAAGRGVRLRPVTEKIPKCMIALKERPMLEHVLDRLISAGINDIHLIVGYKREVIEDHFGPNYKSTKLNYFVQEYANGTAHALSLVEDYIEDRFILANSDVLCRPINYARLADLSEYKRASSIIMCREVHDPWRFGVLNVQGANVIDIVEKPVPGEEPSRLINAGIYGFEKGIFSSVRDTPLSQRNEFEIVDSIRDYISKKNRMEYRMIEGHCIDIEHIHDVEEANDLEKGDFPE